MVWLSLSHESYASLTQGANAATIRVGNDFPTNSSHRSDLNKVTLPTAKSQARSPPLASSRPKKSIPTWNGFCGYS